MRDTKAFAFKEKAAVRWRWAARKGCQPEPATQNVCLEEWSPRESRKAARLLVEIREYLASQGILSVHDPRIERPLRQLWLKLVASDAVQYLSVSEVGRQWQCLKRSETKRTRVESVQPVANRETSVTETRARLAFFQECDFGGLGSIMSHGSV
jgi:hypothetical protein